MPSANLPAFPSEAKPMTAARDCWKLLDRTSQPRLKRTSHPKVRTGCLTCKARHVKCDERKPLCGRCERSGHKCGGYLDPVDQPRTRSLEAQAIVGERQLSEPADLRPKPLQRRIVRTASSSSPPLWVGRYLSPILLSGQDVTYFDAFRHHIVGDFNAWIDPGFWDILVMRESMQDETIRHCILGLAALTQSMWFPKEQAEEIIRNPDLSDHLSKNLKTTNRHHEAALGHYQTAISTSRRNLEPGGAIPTAYDMKRLLISTIVFILFEMMQGDIGAAITLATNGRQIVEHALARDASLCLDEEFAMAEKIFSQFAFIITGLRASYHPEDSKRGAEMPNLQEVLVPDGTASATSIQAQWGRLFRPMQPLVVRLACGNSLFRSMSQDLYKRMSISLSDMIPWQTVIEDHIRKSRDPKVRRSLLLTKVQILAAKIFLSYNFSLADSTFDLHVPDFREIIDIAQTFANTEFSGRMRFTVGFNLLPWLSFTMVRCRDRQVRKSALETFIRLVFRQGGWGNLHLVKAFRAIVDIDDTVVVENGIRLSVPINSWSLTHWDCNQRRVWMRCDLSCVQNDATNATKEVFIDY